MSATSLSVILPLPLILISISELSIGKQTPEDSESCESDFLMNGSLSFKFTQEIGIYIAMKEHKIA